MQCPHKHIRILAHILNRYFIISASSYIVPVVYSITHMARERNAMWWYSALYSLSVGLHLCNFIAIASCLASSGLNLLIIDFLHTSLLKLTKHCHNLQQCTYSISQEICTRFLLCCALLWLYIDWFPHIHQAYFTGTVAIERLPQCQQSNPDEYG